MQRLRVLTMENHTGKKWNGIFDAKVFIRFYSHISWDNQKTKHHLIRKAFSFAQEYGWFDWLSTSLGFQMSLGNTFLFVAGELSSAPWHTLIKTIQRLHCFNSQIASMLHQAWQLPENQPICTHITYLELFMSLYNL